MGTSIGAASHEKLASRLNHKRKELEQVVASISAAEKEVREIHDKKMDLMNAYHEGKTGKPSFQKLDKRAGTLEKKLDDLHLQKESLDIHIEEKTKALALNKYYLQKKEHGQLSKELGRIHSEHQEFEAMAKAKLYDFEKEEGGLSYELQRLSIAIRKYEKGDGLKNFPEIFQGKTEEEQRAEHEERIERRRLSEFGFHVAGVLDHTNLLDERGSINFERRKRLEGLFRSYGYGDFFGKSIDDIVSMEGKKFREFCQESFDAGSPMPRNSGDTSHPG